MSTQLSPEKQKEKTDLVFNYMKSLAPFERKEGYDCNESQEALRKFYKEQRNASMIISSKVVNMKLGDKSKKRVRFLDEMQQGSEPKGFQDKFRSQTNQYQNPEVIKNSLIDLQKSVFSSFNIKQDHPANKQFRSLLKDMEETESMTIESKSKLTQRTKYESQNRSNVQSTPMRIVRSKSELPLASRVREKNKESKLSPRKQQLIVSSKKRKAQIHVNLANRDSEENLSRITSASCQNLRPFSSIIQKKSLLSSRSSKFWKQQNDLMVEIFKNKLRVQVK